MRPALQGSEIVLTQRNLYMLPTGAGWVFAGLLLVMLMTAMNYSNGLAYVLTFLLAATAVVSMLFTHKNLHRLIIKAGPNMPVFAGSSARFAICFENKQNQRLGIMIEPFIKITPVFNKTVLARTDIPGHGRVCVDINIVAKQRGYLPMPTVLLSTRFPLGLLYTWSRRIILDSRCLVYPKPANQKIDLGQEQLSGADHSGHHQQGDDFAGLRKYNLSDPPRHVHWKAVARGRGMQTKIFSGRHSEIIWLDWKNFTEHKPESRISLLTRAVLDADKAGLEYGLRLPGKTIQPTQTNLHRHECLKALALLDV